MPLAAVTTDPLGWISISACLIVGFFLLTKGADWLVGASSQLAKRVGVSSLVIGLTVVALGTSAPEIVVSTIAAADGKVAISIGNVLGSNIANIGLVLGMSALILPDILHTKLTKRDGVWTFVALGLLWWVSSDHRIERWEAGLLLVGFVGYNAHLLFTGREEILEEEAEHEGHYHHPVPLLLAGLVSILVGAKIVVVGAESGALRLGISEAVIGLSIVAVGTSLPELAAGVGGALRGEGDLSVGNVVGSNIFNLLAVVGIAAMVHPFQPENEPAEAARALEHAFDRALGVDFYVVLGFSLAGLLLPFAGGERGARTKGLFLLACYAGYIAWLYLGAR
ncbi:MAG TPA: calcium/sodium antiporter [Planctomycetes bacterium]|nr:calcium/sodium antiporter [Planctomycetota bacterium]